ncbi:hypothetical protein MPL1032_220134 [Mesorhizobium plurifarium]|uniref:Uncharacterized protein n=1 Tax=Mesorhizobium plurifarium TaxID=69974 RepID=A0A0K2VZ19_MESPL|nr:hypothetical protein MPL1032_220134 [Mesorhizobium plurifarium]
MGTTVSRPISGRLNCWRYLKAAIHMIYSTFCKTGLRGAWLAIFQGSQTVMYEPMILQRSRMRYPTAGS